MRSSDQQFDAGQVGELQVFPRWETALSIFRHSSISVNVDPLGGRIFKYVFSKDVTTREIYTAYFTQMVYSPSPSELL